MNPILQETPIKNTPKSEDVVLPRAAPSQPSSSPALRPEMGSSIPVRNPANDATQTSPAQATQQPQQTSTKAEPKSEDQELESILKDVNQSVKKSENNLEERFAHMSGMRKKVAIKKAKVNEAHSGSPPITATVTAVIIAALLITAALKML